MALLQSPAYYYRQMEGIYLRKQQAKEPRMEVILSVMLALKANAKASRFTRHTKSLDFMKSTWVTDIAPMLCLDFFFFLWSYLHGICWKIVATRTGKLGTKCDGLDYLQISCKSVKVCWSSFEKCCHCRLLFPLMSAVETIINHGNSIALACSLVDI